MTILDGKKVAKELRESLKDHIESISYAKGRMPCLHVIMVGEDEASQRYVRNKQKACEEVGIRSVTKVFPEDISSAAIINYIKELNTDKSVDGILIQLPLPQRLTAYTETILSAIDSSKDVDGFKDDNVGKVSKGKINSFIPCTPNGIMTLLNSYNLDVAGKHCVIVGRSNIVGKPMAQLLLNKDATVTICHSKTVDLPSFTRSADILISAVGKPNFISKDMIKPDAIVIDVGINSVNGHLCGDVCKDVADVASYLTPVPGGVGPMTVAMLLQNTYIAACRNL
jgi:methylenetetrahydrofolate dehydrogenase (NADP+)/methenyltetrahydrofolate cyclohydrolase